MPSAVAAPLLVENLKDLTRLIQTADGFHPVVAALKNGHGATIDGAWGSSEALAAAALGIQAPKTLLVVLAHPGDVDAWVDDLHTFAGMRPTVFPAWEHLPGAASVADEVLGQRLRILK